MNRRPAASFALIVCLAVIPLLGFAQAGTPSTPPADAPLRPLPPSDTAQPAPPTYELTLKWDDRGSATILEVPLANTSDKPLKVIGVQASRGIFIGDHPSTVSAKGEGKISFAYESSDNTDGDWDLIRVLTDQGIKEILVKVVREEAAKFEAREVSWTVGDAVATKSVTITVKAGTASPVKVRAAGGHQAVLEAVDATTWRVKITPASTAKSGKFPVIVEFDKALPGKAPVILGIINPKE